MSNEREVTTVFKNCYGNYKVVQKECSSCGNLSQGDIDIKNKKQLWLLAIALIKMAIINKPSKIIRYHKNNG